MGGEPMRVGAGQSPAAAASPPPPATAGPAAAQPLRTGTGIILTPEPGRWWPATRDGRRWSPELSSGSPIRLKPTPPLGPAAATAAATAAVGGPPLRVARSWPLGGPARPLEAHPRPIPLPLPPRALTADRGGHGGDSRRRRLWHAIRSRDPKTGTALGELWMGRGRWPTGRQP